jgi:uncharacterized protein (TIGR00369 family)
MEPRTHLAINARLCGEIKELAEGEARVELVTTEEMAADERGLVHGSFPFGVADYAAMLAVNDPNVVLAKAETKFLRPVKVGETIEAFAQVVKEDGKKRSVDVTVSRDGESVLVAHLLCAVLEEHVFDVGG